MAIVAEMVRYNGSGERHHQSRAACLAILYAGGLMGVFVQLRLIMCATSSAGIGRSHHWAMHMLLVFIFTVKISDIGQYAFGRGCSASTNSRRRLAPARPGKERWVACCWVT